MKKMLAVMLSCILCFSLPSGMRVSAEDGDETTDAETEEIVEEYAPEETTDAETEEPEDSSTGQEEAPEEISVMPDEKVRFEEETGTEEPAEPVEEKAAADPAAEESADETVVPEEAENIDASEEFEEETDALVNEPQDIVSEAETADEDNVLIEENEEFGTEDSSVETVYYKMLEDGTSVMLGKGNRDSSNLLSADAGNLIKLSTPTDLGWGKAVEYVPGETEIIDIPGAIYFKPGKTTQDEYNFVLYKDGKAVDNFYQSLINHDIADGTIYLPSAFLCDYDFTAGDYYYTVQAIGDHTQYSDSSVAKSPIWHYNGCSDRLVAPSEISLSDVKMKFTMPDSKYCGGFDLDIYFAKTTGEKPAQVGGISSDIRNSSLRNRPLEREIYQSCLEANGAGYYSFEVRAISNDINVINSSKFSARSNAVFINATQIKSELDTIVANANSGSISNDQIRSEVQKINTEQLKKAMLIDSQDTGVVKDLQELESKLGGSEIVVKNEAKNSFNSSEISMTGAALNTLSNPSAKVSLIVDKPSRDDVIPTMYDNTVAVKFSMHLDNIKDTNNLKVPVKIVMPVPAGISPSFMRIIHYKADGSIRETIHPYTFWKNDKTYASFVLTSFSDFAIVTEKQYPAACKLNGFCTYDGKDYWYENGERQGTVNDPKGVIGDGTNRGREIFDPDTSAWYWLDSVYDGAKAVGKEVWMPYIYQDEANWKNDTAKMNDIVQKINSYSENGGPTSDMGEQVRQMILSGRGKWVRYDENGKMLKGWVTITGELEKLYPDQKGYTYFYDYMTGLMAKGWTTIGGERRYFDETTGVLQQ